MSVTQVKLSTVKTPRKYNTVSAGFVKPTASGGTETTSGSDTIRTFTANGNLVVTNSGSSERNTQVAPLTTFALIVGGGAHGGAGAAGAQGAGSGGGGGVQNHTSSALTLSPATYGVTVAGVGGTSTFNSTSAGGGATGGFAHGNDSSTGGPSGTPQSNAGGNRIADGGTGRGGGAGSSGNAGGTGLSYTISGSSLTYGIGGNLNTGATGAAGGGGGAQAGGGAGFTGQAGIVVVRHAS